MISVLLSTLFYSSAGRSVINFRQISNTYFLLLFEKIFHDSITKSFKSFFLLFYINYYAQTIKFMLKELVCLVSGGGY